MFMGESARSENDLTCAGRLTLNEEGAKAPEGGTAEEEEDADADGVCAFGVGTPVLSINS
jgi:hypothetical protein